MVELAPSPRPTWFMSLSILVKVYMSLLPNSALGILALVITLGLTFSKKLTVGLLMLLVFALGYMARLIIIHRCDALDNSRTLLEQRIESSRAIRTARYDVYLPSANATKNQPGLVIFPGALVEHTAYALLASMLSDKGIVTVVVSHEPIRMASQVTGASVDSVKAILDELRQSNPSIKVDEWALGGHSMGASAAWNILPTLGWSKIVLLASTSSGEKQVSLRDTTDHLVLCIDASNDGLLAGIPESFKTKFRETMIHPGCTTFVMIQGGNHAGFGNYGPQTWPMADGERTISLETQHEKTVDAIFSFLSDSTTTQKPGAVQQKESKKES